jgi:hypothetical protein
MHVQKFGIGGHITSEYRSFFRIIYYGRILFGCCHVWIKNAHDILVAGSVFRYMERTPTLWVSLHTASPFH